MQVSFRISSLKSLLLKTNGQNQLNNTILELYLLMLWIFIRANDISVYHKQALTRNPWSCLVETFTTRIYEYFKSFVLSPVYEKANESLVLLVYKYCHLLLYLIIYVFILSNVRNANININAYNTLFLCSILILSMHKMFFNQNIKRNKNYHILSIQCLMKAFDRLNFFQSCLLVS